MVVTAILLPQDARRGIEPEDAYVVDDDDQVSLGRYFTVLPIALLSGEFLY